MDDVMIESKAMEYEGRLSTAIYLGDPERARKLARTILVLLRLKSRKASRTLALAQDRLRAMRRTAEKMKAGGVQFPLGEQWIRKLEEERDSAEKALAGVGLEMHTMLELWQSLGATFEDLCNFCNRDPAQVRRELGDERMELSLSNLAMVYNLDYKDPRDTGWLEDSVDAPMTHALKAYLLDTMLHTEAGRKASHEAMMAVFPEIMDKALTEYTDADGVRHLVDKDGVEICTLDDET